VKFACDQLIWRIFLKRLGILLLLSLAATVILVAQAAGISPDSNTPVDFATLDWWLHSGDPRLIAWAADLARRDHVTKIIDEIPEMLEHTNMPPSYGGDQSQAAQRRAILAMLDALIQENHSTPTSTIKAIATTFPAQPTVLISRHPLSESRRVLDDWALGTSETGWNGQILARIASMLLAVDPKPSRGIWNHDIVGFVASVVAASELELQITLNADGSKGSLINSGMCADFLGVGLLSGWPQVYAYDLVENDPCDSGLEVVTLDGDRIISRRFEENHHPGSCYGVQPLNSSTRSKLIAHWLGIQQKDMPWKPAELFTIRWTNNEAYQKQLGEITAAEHAKLSTTVEELRQRGLLTEYEAASVTPRLVVTVHCDINPCPIN
jgi:hypothetical protein